MNESPSEYVFRRMGSPSFERFSEMCASNATTIWWIIGIAAALLVLLVIVVLVISWRNTIGGEMSDTEEREPSVTTRATYPL